MKKQINEIKRMQQLAGILKEDDNIPSSESDLISLLNLDGDVNFNNGVYTVFFSGSELSDAQLEFGYEDARWYEMEWNPENKTGYQTIYLDRNRSNVLNRYKWSEPINSLKDFADIVNGEANGNWN